MSQSYDLHPVPLCRQDPFSSSFGTIPFAVARNYHSKREQWHVCTIEHVPSKRILRLAKIFLINIRLTRDWDRLKDPSTRGGCLFLRWVSPVVGETVASGVPVHWWQLEMGSSSSRVCRFEQLTLRQGRRNLCTVKLSAKSYFNHKSKFI